MKFLGIDTSNYTTSIAVSENGLITANLKRLLDVPEGERGLRQSDALFCHVKRLPEMFESLGAVCPCAVGVSERPRNVDGSYMPCFLAGVSVASAISSSFGIPLYRFSHQEGHIAAALYSAKREDLLGKELIALHLSGGTTELLHVIGSKAEIIGKTSDISCGMTIDRVGVMTGLKFPCGAEMEKLSEGIPFPKVKVSVKDGCCNLSGVENKAQKMIKDGTPNEEIYAYVLSFVCETVSKMIEYATKEYPGLPVLLSGGVSSNKRIREILYNRFGCLFAEPQFSSDNAAGIARLTEIRYLENQKK